MNEMDIRHESEKTTLITCVPKNTKLREVARSLRLLQHSELHSESVKLEAGGSKLWDGKGLVMTKWPGKAWYGKGRVLRQVGTLPSPLTWNMLM